MRFHETKHEIDGWEIFFKNNVHMYCHQLTVKKENLCISIPCEDLPCKDRTIGIWVEKIKESEEVKKELKNVLSKWCKEVETKSEIYLEL